MFIFDRMLIKFTEDKTESEWNGYMYAVLMFGLAVGKTIFEYQQRRRICGSERKLWTAITSVIYKKVLSQSFI